MSLLTWETVIHKHVSTQKRSALEIGNSKKKGDNVGERELYVPITERKSQFTGWKKSGFPHTTLSQERDRAMSVCRGGDRRCPQKENRRRKK